jgi:hypothetical protein
MSLRLTRSRFRFCLAVAPAAVLLLVATLAAAPVALAGGPPSIANDGYENAGPSGGLLRLYVSGADTVSVKATGTPIGCAQGVEPKDKCPIYRFSRSLTHVGSGRIWELRTQNEEIINALGSDVQVIRVSACNSAGCSKRTIGRSG